MPVYEITLSDGRTFEVESDAPPSEQDVMSALPTMGTNPPTASTPEEQGSGGPSATIAAARGVPAAIRSVGRFAANHPAGTQKAIGAGISTVAGGIGAGVGGVPGAVVGASIRGVTPAQSAIRETAGRMAGEAPTVAKNAGRALGVINYAKETPGLHVGTKDLVSTGNPTKALDSYADSMGQKVVRILGPDGKVVIGPEAPKPTPKPSRVGGAIRTGASGIGRVLSAIAGPVGMTDLAQTIEPTRRDIGVMGIGASQPDPSGDELAQINQRNVQQMQERLQAQDAMRARVLAFFGLQ